MRVLYVEDSKTLREGVTHSLRRAGYVVTSASNGVEGFDLAQVHSFDLIILDIMLPKMNGFEILKSLREDGNKTAVIMLTARDSVDDRIGGLDLGADDYLVKPFAIDELLARIRAVIRRQFEASSNTISIGGLRINISSRRVIWKDKEVVLRPREFDILEFLALRVGKVTSRTMLVEHVYDHALDLKSNAVDSAVCNLRKKLGNAGAENIITTVSRLGYMLESSSN